MSTPREGGVVVRMSAAARVFGNGRGLQPTSLVLRRGEIAALVGPSGAGKSTLLDLLSAELAPCEGSVEVLGQRIANLQGRALKRARAQVGVVPQGGGLTMGLSVLHNVLIGCLGRWSTLRAVCSRVWPRQRDVEQAQAALAAVELHDRLRDDPAQLSGGERQRVALARLLLQRPQLWLVDEPTLGLDVRLRAEALSSVLRQIREAGASAVVALHALDLLDARFDRVWGVRAGKLELDAPYAQARCQLRALYEAAT